MVGCFSFLASLQFCCRGFLKLPLSIIFLCFGSYALAAEDLIEEKNLEVITVIDGDTIVIKDSKKQEKKVRLAGIQAPELFSEPEEKYAKDAKDILEKLLQGHTVNIIYNKKTKYDKYDRILADVYIHDNSTWVNAVLVELGLSYVYLVGKMQLPKVDNLIILEDQAIANKKSIWSEDSVLIAAQEMEKHVGYYKIIDAVVVNTRSSKHSIWLELSDQKSQGSSIRIDKDKVSNFPTSFNFKDLEGKKIRIRGYVEKYSPKYGAFVNVVFPYAIKVME